MSQSRQTAKLFFSRPNWESPIPSPGGECVPPFFSSGGGGGTLAFRRGGGGGPYSDEGTDTAELEFLKTLWGLGTD